MRAAFIALILASPALAEDIRIGTGGTYAPYILHGEGGQIDGLDAMILGEICARAGWTCSWHTMPVADLVDAVARGEVDIAAGGIGITAERDAIIDFTCPYHETVDPEGYMYSRGDPLPADPVYGTVTGTLFEIALRQDGKTPRGYVDDPALLEALLFGEIDIAFGSLPMSNIAWNAGFSYIGPHPTPSSGAAYGVAEDRPQLLAELEGHLADLSTEGRIAAAQETWLNINQGDVIANCAPLALS